MTKAFRIKEVKPGIFLFEFKQHYDMCMFFLRYQEYYESSSPKFRGKSFAIFDFMKWYSLKYGKGSFTYPNDWNGFNIPSSIIFDVWNKHDIPDKNIYDYEMLQAWKECNAKIYAATEKAVNDFYIIGVVRGNNALNHEIAHGMFYLDPEYRKEMTKLVKALPKNIKTTINSGLKMLGYTPKVYIDETQAYMSTGLTEAFGLDTGQWREERKPFIACFKKYSRKSK